MQLQNQDQNGQQGDQQGQGDQTAGTEDLPTDTGEDKDGKGDEDLDAMAPPEEDTSGIKSMLDKVIDMLKSDSEARKAESNAKAKEAEAREAEAAARIASMKVKSEEEVMGAENYFKQQQKNLVHHTVFTFSQNCRYNYKH